jgi:hypothetical protein
MTPDRDTRLDRWLADPANPIPVHADPHAHAEVNWNLLTLTLGWKTTCAATLFGRNRTSNLQRIARVERALAHGHPTTTGVIDNLTRIEHRDGRHAGWHPGLTPQAIGLQLRMLRNTCYTLVIGLSMMRDSEKRAKVSTHQYFSNIAGCGTSTRGECRPAAGRSIRRTPQQKIQSSHRLAYVSGTCRQRPTV